MTDKLPPNLLALFAPRPPLRYLPPADHPPEDRRTAQISGIAQYVAALKEKSAEAAAVEAGKVDDPEIVARERPPTESKLEAYDRIRSEKREKQKWLATKGMAEFYKPSKDPNIRGDAFKTLFVGRLSYNTTVNELEREFLRYGPIERTRIIYDNPPEGKMTKNRGKSKGYGFVVFERERDMKAAYKECDQLYIQGRRVLVDVERGRTVTGWKPRRFGGGLGGRGYTKPAIPRPSFGLGLPPGPGGFRGGGFRGGRGGFRGGGGGGGFRGAGGGGYGGRGGVGYSNGPPPDGAPAGPRSGGGYGGRSYGGGGGYDDRGGGPRNANYEPLPPRGNYRDRDRDGGDRGGGSYGGGGSYNSGQKRPYEGGGYDESRSRRRY